MLAALAISFTSWDLLSSPRWVGLANYREMMADRLFWIALKNTVYFTVVSVPVTLLLALGLAALMNRKLRGISVLRAIYFFPVTASIVAVSLLWSWMYTPDFGIINYLLSLLGLPKVNWLVDPTDGDAERHHHERLARTRVQHRRLPCRVAEHSRETSMKPRNSMVLADGTSSATSRFRC